MIAAFSMRSADRRALSFAFMAAVMSLETMFDSDIAETGVINTGMESAAARPPWRNSAVTRGCGGFGYVGTHERPAYCTAGARREGLRKADAFRLHAVLRLGIAVRAGGI